MQLKKTKVTFNDKLIMNFNMHADDSKTEVTFNNNSITWMLRNLNRYLLQHHGWQILRDQTGDHS